MERKYYLRGLGLGIVVTAVIMGIALPGNKTMTNDEIKARAKELGMVENTVLSNTDSGEAEQENTVVSAAEKVVASQIQDVSQLEQDEKQDASEISDSDIDSMAESEGDVDIAGNEEAESEEESNVESDLEADSEPESSESEDVNESTTTPTIKMITINSGDGSYTVAKKLEDIGVVTSATSFDAFLCEHGYDKRLRTGNFSIPSDASDEEIARIVTSAE